MSQWPLNKTLFFIRRRRKRRKRRRLRRKKKKINTPSPPLRNFENTIKTNNNNNKENHQPETRPKNYPGKDRENESTAAQNEPRTAPERDEMPQRPRSMCERARQCDLTAKPVSWRRFSKGIMTIIYPWVKYHYGICEALDRILLSSSTCSF